MRNAKCEVRKRRLAANSAFRISHFEFPFPLDLRGPEATVFMIHREPPAGCGVSSTPARLIRIALAEKGKDGLKKEIFGRTPDGEKVESYELTNANGLEARIITYGAAVVSLRVPDRDGKIADVVLGFETMDGYAKGDRYFGAITGRFANRIRRGR